MTIDTSKLIEEQDNYLMGGFFVVNKFKETLKRGELTDIILRVVSYTQGIEHETRRAYLYDTYGVFSLGELMNTDFPTSIQKPIKQTQIKTHIKSRAWKNSLTKVVLAHINLNKSPRQSGNRVEGEDEIGSPNQEIERYSLELVSKYRKDEALKIQQEYDLDKNIQQEVFEEIRAIVGSKQYASESELKVIRFLEFEGIELGLKNLYLDLGWQEQYRSLYQLRVAGGEVNNTACHACGKTLYRHRQKSSRYCTQLENRSCYEARKQVSKLQGDEWAYVYSRKRCMKCGKDSNYSHTHKVNDVVCYFCSSRCYQAFRKTPKARN